MSGTICAMYGCSNYGIKDRQKSFFRFPKELIRCKQWVHLCCRSDLDAIIVKHGPEHISKMYRLCSDHFTPKMLKDPKLTSQGLKKNAVPDKNIFNAEGTRENHPLKKRTNEQAHIQILPVFTNPEINEYEMEYKNPLIGPYDHILLSKIDIKEEPLWPKTISKEIKLTSESVYEDETGSAERNDGTYGDAAIIEPKVEIKEESDWAEGSPEINFQHAASCITGADEDLLSAPTRFCSEVFSYDGSKASPSVFVADAEEKHDAEKAHLAELHLNIFKKQYTEWQTYLQNLNPNKSTLSCKNKTSKSQMKKDIVVDKRPHTCEICQRSFILLSHLKRHKFTHEGKKPFSCEICGKQFTRDSCLRKHRLLHEGNRPHKCEICNRSFAQVSYLKAHNLTHDSKKPHKCAVCDRSFTRMAELKRHNKLVHEKSKSTSATVTKTSLKISPNGTFY